MKQRAVVVLWVALTSLACRDMCANTQVAEYPSPDGKLKVVVFERNCGATTGFTTQAGILPSDQEWPNQGGNLFIADTDHGAAPSAAWGGPDLSVRWESPTSLVLTHDPATRVFKAETQKREVGIRYIKAPAEPDNNEMKLTDLAWQSGLSPQLIQCSADR